MSRRRWGWIAVGATVLAVGIVAWLPGYRLGREMAAARREGLWTEAADVRRDVGAVPESQNAAPLIRLAAAREKADPNAEAWDEAARALLKGKATPAQAALLRRDLAAHPERTALWGAASARRGLDYGRPWEDAGAVLFPEYAPVRRGVRRLAVAAHLGERPRENLLAAARLADLTRREPVILASLVSVAMGRIALREARREGIAREVEAALGPPIDVRRAYAAEPFFGLDLMRGEGTEAFERRLGVRNPSSWPYRLAHAEPMRSAQTAAVLSDWRGLWRDLGNGTDYDAAARAMRRWMPRIERRQAEWSAIYVALGDEPGHETGAIETFAKYEAERRAARR